MATVNKDFKIKHGLVVEGTNATVNGYDLLKKSPADDNYIIDLIGGETLVKSVEGTQLEVNGAGELSVKAEVFDDFGSASDAQAAAALDATAKADAAEGAAKTYADGLAEGVAGDLSDHEALTSGVHGVTGNVVGTTDQQDLSNKRIIDTLEFSDGATLNQDAQIEVFSGSHLFNIQANAGDLNLKAVATGASVYVISEDADIVLAAEGESYIGSVAAGNIVATVAYADDVAGDALADANTYTDGAIGTEVTSRNTAIGTAKDEAIAAANLYTDGEIADLVNSAPAMLDTLGELAAALENNPDIISDLQDVAAGKQDTLTAGSNIDITGSVISVTGLDTEDVEEHSSRLYFTDARALTATAFAYDPAGAAADAEANAINAAAGDATTKADAAEESAILAAAGDATTKANAAEQNAKDYADALTTDDVAEGVNQYFTDARASDSAVNLLVNATQENIDISWTLVGGLVIAAENGVAGSTTDELAEGVENLYFTTDRAVNALQAVVPNFTAVEIDAVAKQIAAQVDAPTAGVQVGHAFAKADYRSAEYLVKIAYGTHTEISKVLLTLDTSDNIAITEYGIVGTNGSSSSISAGISGTDVQLLVTTTNNNSTVTVMGTLLK